MVQSKVSLDLGKHQDVAREGYFYGFINHVRKSYKGVVLCGGGLHKS